MRNYQNHIHIEEIRDNNDTVISRVKRVGRLVYIYIYIYIYACMFLYSILSVRIKLFSLCSVPIV